MKGGKKEQSDLIVSNPSILPTWSLSNATSVTLHTMQAGEECGFPLKFTVYEQKWQVLVTSARTLIIPGAASSYLRFGTGSPTRITLSRGIALHQ